MSSFVISAMPQILQLRCLIVVRYNFFFFSSRRRHTRYIGDWSSDVCSSDLCAASWKTWAPRSEPSGSARARERESGAEGKKVELGGRRIIKKKKKMERGR